jgi:hypothetical protein
MEQIELLEQAVDVLARLDFDTLSDEELAEVLVECNRIEDQMAAAYCWLTAAFETREPNRPRRRSHGGDHAAGSDRVTGHVDPS